MRALSSPLAVALVLASFTAGAVPQQTPDSLPAPGMAGSFRWGPRRPTQPPSPALATWLVVFRGFTDDDARRALLLDSELAAVREIGAECVRSLEGPDPRPTGDAWKVLVAEHVSRLRGRLGEAAYVSLASYAWTTWERVALVREEGDAGPPLERRRQEIRFRPLPPAYYRDPAFTAEARATSGLPVYLRATGDCTVHGLLVRVVTSGRCWITASQPGNEEYDPAPDVVQVLQIRKANQWIMVADLPPEFPFGSGTLFAGMRASSGLDVVVRADGCCTADGASIRFTGIGSCLITGHQPGSANYAAAPIVERVVTVVKGDQTIQLPDLGERTHGPDDVPFVPIASSGLRVLVSTQGPCVFTGQALRVTGTGACVITAEQPGNENYNPAPKAFATVNVARPESSW